MIEKRSCSLSTKVDRHFYDMVKVISTMYKSFEFLFGGTVQSFAIAVKSIELPE